MPVGLTSQISIRPQTTVDDLRFAADEARKREIEALEAANFALRDHITRLKLHNATLDRMLKQRDRSPGANSIE
jgi:hypothetical protein